MPVAVKSSLRFRLLFVFSAALIWYTSGVASQAFSSAVKYAPGADLVYIPAGVRLLLVLVLRLWGAIGITIANPFLFVSELGRDDFYEVILNSLICGFVPLFTLYLAEMTMKIGPNLSNLRQLQLSYISLTVAVTTPSAILLNSFAFGHLDPQSFFPTLTAMILGDFVGCLIVIVFAFGSIKLYRTFKL